MCGLDLSDQHAAPLRMRQTRGQAIWALSREPGLKNGFSRPPPGHHLAYSSATTCLVEEAPGLNGLVPLLRSMLFSPSCAELSGQARRVSGPRQDRTTARDSPPGPQNARTGPTGCRGASAEFVKSMCCSIWVEQGSRTRVPLCAGQARIEQRSEHTGAHGAQK